MEPFVIEHTYNAPTEKVWKAITDKNEMRKWYFDLVEFKPIVGFKFSFTGGSEEKQYLHLCEITQVEEGKLLAHSWRYEDYPGSSEVKWELFPEGDKTRVRLTHTGLESFPQNEKDFAKESFSKGWSHIVGISLKDFVENV